MRWSSSSSAIWTSLTRPPALVPGVPSGYGRGQRTDLDPHRLGGELPRDARPRLPRDRHEGAPPTAGRTGRARRSDRLLRHRRAGVRRRDQGNRRDVRGPLQDLAGEAEEPGSVSVALRDRARADPRGELVRAGRDAGGRPRARTQVAARALAARVPGPAAGGLGP